MLDVKTLSRSVTADVSEGLIFKQNVYIISDPKKGWFRRSMLNAGSRSSERDINNENQ